MDREAAWQVITSQRLSLADLLEEPDPAAMGQPIAVLAVAGPRRGRPPRAGPTGLHHRCPAGRRARTRQLPPPQPRPGGPARRPAHRGPGRRAAGPCRITSSFPVLTNYRNILIDILVHGQDIAIPLGSPDLPTDAAPAGAIRVWTMGWPFYARRTLRRYKRTATDTTWASAPVPRSMDPSKGCFAGAQADPRPCQQLSGPGLHALTTQVSRTDRG